MISTTDYKDMYKKLCFHRERVIKDLLKQGIYPDETLVKTKIANIDHRLALFKKYTFMPGTTVNVIELNNSLDMIHKDLEFLYEILIDIYNNEYSKLTTYIESHLNQLEAVADLYDKRAKEETNSTTFGKTLYFKSNSFDVATNDDQTEIDLGEIDLVSGSTIACFANINNTESQDIAFAFDASDKDLSFNTLAYNYNNSKIKIPGELSINKYDLELNKDFVIRDNVMIQLEKVYPTNEYKIMGGKNHVLVKNLDTMQEYLYDMPSFETTLKIPFRAHVSFYIVDGSEFEYMFNTRPIHTNFSLSNSSVKVTNDNNYVFMEVPKDFTFGLTISDGDVYAVKENGIIKDNILYYYGNKDVESLQVREYVRSNKVSYNAKVIIKTDEISHLDIDSIYIKELN